VRFRESNVIVEKGTSTSPTRLAPWLMAISKKVTLAAVEAKARTDVAESRWNE
jgi:hypothetical protein